MTVKELQGVLCGTVVLYEEIPRTDRDHLPLPGEWYRDLYIGMSRGIPEELRHRDVVIVHPGKRKREIGADSASTCYVDIQLGKEAPE